MLARRRTGNDDRGVRYRAQLFISVVAGLATFSGCSLLHHSESPQQQFIESVERGNSAQASQIWLKMSADDRANFSHNIGFQPQTSITDLKAELARRAQAAAAAADPESGGAFVGDNEQTVEYPGLDQDLHAGSLQNLPNIQATVNPPAGPPTDSVDLSSQ